MSYAAEVEAEVQKAARKGGTTAGIYSGPADLAAAACEPYINQCAAECTTAEFVNGAALQPDGCLRGCLARGARAYCEARCPLVDEDLDFECIDRCEALRSNRSDTCINRCTDSCETQVVVQEEGCRLACSKPGALVSRSGDQTVEECTAFAQVHPTHASALCLTSCRHNDLPCLRSCAQTPAEAIVSCTSACAQNNTFCITRCLQIREQLGGECILPCVLNTCNYTSIAIGKGAEHVGYGTMPNALAIKFDTWYNADKNDPYLNHIAVHVSSLGDGASTDSKLALALAYDIPDLADGSYHRVNIAYTPEFDTELELTAPIMPGLAARMTSASRGNMRYMGVLRVRLDGQLAIAVPFNLEDAILLEDGHAYVGFTGATGAAYQEHAISEWKWEAHDVRLDPPANLHCRHRVPSLMAGAPYYPVREALACTTEVVEPETPAGAMHSVRCTTTEEGYVYCHDPNMQNAAPVVHRPPPDISVALGHNFTHTLPPDTFLDKQSDGTMRSELLRYSLVHVLPWLKFEPATRTMYGVPERPGTWPITVVATDPGFRDGLDPPLYATAQFHLQVRDAQADQRADYWRTPAASSTREAAAADAGQTAVLK